MAWAHEQNRSREDVFEEWSIPEHHPAVLGLLMDAEGNLWAASRHKGEAIQFAAPAEFQVFAPDGRWLGTVEVPRPEGYPRDAHFRTDVLEDEILHIGRHRVLVRHFDEARVPTLRGYDISKT